MEDSFLNWFIGALIAIVVLSGIGWAKYENEKSWAQTDACTAKGGVMIVGSINGCVRIISISSEK